MCRFPRNAKGWIHTYTTQTHKSIMLLLVKYRRVFNQFSFYQIKELVLLSSHHAFFYAWKNQLSSSLQWIYFLSRSWILHWKDTRMNTIVFLAQKIYSTHYFRKLKLWIHFCVHANSELRTSPLVIRSW